MSVKRTSAGLRDILFDEIEQLRGVNGDPQRAQAVAQVARQIINTVRIELDFAKEVMSIKERGGDVVLGTLGLGDQSIAPSVPATVTDQSSGTPPKGPVKRSSPGLKRRMVARQSAGGVNAGSRLRAVSRSS